ncbi:MAG TPA: hypothetical protein PKC97_05545 [Burkholderiaceae bacterium]|nr:hypothetical protein [Burkholderiaceae bacterium]
MARFLALWSMSEMICNRGPRLGDDLLISCGQNFLLALCNGVKSSNGAVSSRVDLATMKAQQAVAKHFVGRRVTRSTCLFFGCGMALRAFTSLRDMSLQRNGFTVAARG